MKELYSKIDGLKYAEKISFLCEHFLGRPYIPSPIDDEKDKLLRLDGFDCVTFVETVLAFSLADSNEDVIERLRTIRYSKQISFATRRHFTSIDWYPGNQGLFRIHGATSRRNIWIDRKAFFGDRGLPEDLAPRAFVSFPYTEKPDASVLPETPAVIFVIGNRDWIVVDHMGIYNNGNFYHASSEKQMVVKEAIVQYIRDRKSKLGITILGLR